MSDSGWVTATGHSQYTLAGGISVAPEALLCFLDSVATPRARQIDDTYPRQWKWLGGVGLLTNDNNPVPTLTKAVIFYHPLIWEFEEVPLHLAENTGLATVTDIFWKLPLGVEWKFKLYW